jgi:hypothetical protein
VQSAGVDPAHAARDHACLRGGAHDERIELFAPRLGLLLRVVEARQRPAFAERQALEVEQDRRRGQGAGERAAAGLVGAGDEATTEIPVEREQLPPGVARSLAPFLRGCRLAWGASR